MLVISRKSQQSIVIGDTIRVTILKIERNVVRLGVDAPRDLRVLRTELDRIGKEDRHEPH